MADDYGTVVLAALAEAQQRVAQETVASVLAEILATLDADRLNDSRAADTFYEGIARAMSAVRHIAATQGVWREVDLQAQALIREGCLRNG